MRKTILLTVLLFATVQFTVAQNTIAKLKFEEAEESYANNNFELTLDKLKEVEAILKSTNPKILYLKILSLNQIISKNVWASYSTIENLRKCFNKYLKEYENLPDNEDKYREVYKISEKFKDSPTSIEEFNNAVKQIEIDKSNKNKQYDDLFMTYQYYDSYKLGLTLEETIKQYPEFKKYYKYNNELDESYDYSIAAKSGGKEGGITGLLIKSNKVIGYYGFFMISNEDNKFTKGTNKITEMVNTKISEFNFNPIEKTTDVSRKDWPGKETSYSWIKNNKTIQLIHLKQYNQGAYYSIISIYTFDQNLAK